MTACILFSSFWARFSWAPFFSFLLFFFLYLKRFRVEINFLSFLVSFFLFTYSFSVVLSFFPSFLSFCLSACLSFLLSFFDFLSLYLKALLGPYLECTYLVSREFIFLSSPFTDITIRRNIQISSTVFI